MNQTNIRYNLFRTVGVREVLRSLSNFDLGRKVMDAVKEYHDKAEDVERIPLDPKQVWPILAHELAWRYFDQHDASPDGLATKLRILMRAGRMSSDEAYRVYAGAVYTDARARLVLRDLRSKGRA